MSGVVGERPGPSPEARPRTAPLRIGPIEQQSELERFTTFRAIVDAVTAVAAERPVLVVLDDLHTCDPASLLLTRLLVRTSRAASLHLVMTSRETDSLSPVLDALVRDSQVLVLAPLSQTGLRPFSSSQASAGSIKRAPSPEPCISFRT